MENKSEKIFVQIVQQLRELIEERNMKPGDKMPSERVLSETLQVSRSSIREALRSLELLGLIQSKHGGGTFLSDAGGHQLVELVSSFILQNEKSSHDVLLTRRMHEKEAIRTISNDSTLRNLEIWDSFFRQVEISEPVLRESLLKELIVASGNRLSLKIWIQLNAYSHQALKQNIEHIEKENIKMLLKSMQMGYEQEAIEAYTLWLDSIE